MPPASAPLGPAGLASRAALAQGGRPAPGPSQRGPRRGSRRPAEVAWQRRGCPPGSTHCHT
eukprot:2457585-Alexandrium_andersonii.AAC.1